MKSINFPTIVFLLLVVSGTSCTKYLDAKPDAKLVVPSTLQDLQALLDYYPRVNHFEPYGAEASADNYYLTTTDWAAVSPEGLRQMYRWDPLFSIESIPNDWSSSYDVVYLANTVLDNLDGIRREAGDEAAWNNLKGMALVHRARSLLQIAYIWAPAYDGATASTELGIPLRLDGDFNKVSVRATVQQTYERILQDFKEAVPLLPVKPNSVLRPSRPAAYGLLARTYLSMRRYEEALLYADSCLQLYSKLIDYNTLNAGAAFPVPEFNEEVILKTKMIVPQLLADSRAKIDSNLYRSYNENDLRKKVFFKSAGSGTYGFKGSYEGSTALFNGLATDEVYLMRSECYARKGNTDAALSDLNTLLEKRWKTGTFTPYTTAAAGDVLQLVLAERRKELLMRGLRWMDIKRLNREGAGITLKRVLNGQEYTLPSNDPRYALPIPENVVALTGVPQNPR